LRVLDVNKVTGTLWVRCPEQQEWFWIEFARAHPLVRAASQDRGGISAFTVPPSEMPPSTEEEPHPHDLWFLENTGQTITSGSPGGGPPQTGTPGSDMNLLNAWTITQGDPDIRLAIFDTGVDYEHPEFDGRLHPSGLSYVCGPGGFSPFHCCSGSPLVCNWGEPTDNDGHGTSVAGVAAANADNGTPSSIDETQYVGVDPGCTIFPVRLSWKNVPSLEATNLALAAIVSVDVYPPMVHVINMSYGFIRNDEDEAQIEMKALLDECREMGIVVVVAAMNQGSGTVAGIVPAAWDNVITVAASDMNDNRPSFSGTGPSVDFAAPGWGMYIPFCPQSRGCDPNYAVNYLMGTSASAPGVAGVVTLLLARAKELDVTLSVDDVFDILKAGAVRLGSTPYPNQQFGWGRVRAYESLLELDP
jgi:subtilisin family serine protease